MAEVIPIGRPAISNELRAMVEGARPRVAKIARSVARFYRMDNAEDLAQLAMLKVLELAPEYDATRGASFDTYVYRTARRVMVEACVAERKDFVIAEAIARGTRVVFESLDFGDPFAEDEQARAERLRDAREAMRASAILGLFSSPGTPEDLLILEQERAGLKEKVQRAVMRLDETDRALVWSCICEGTQIKGVAETLALDYDNARHRLRTSLRRLSQWLNSEALR